MSKRTERREAEQAARKEAYKQLRLARAQPADIQQPTAVVAEPQQQECPVELVDLPTVSDAQLNANRANSQLSSGPKSEAGKAKSSLNALKHGLTSQIVVLATEDPLEYNRRLESYIARLKPVNEEELRLVQCLLDATWRIERMRRLESSVFLKGYLEFENKFEDRTEFERKSLIQAEVYLKYEKSFRNLYAQEARLARCRLKDEAELTRLQTLRKREDRIAAEATNPQPTHVRPANQVPAKNGFVFSATRTHLPDPLSKAA